MPIKGLSNQVRIPRLGKIHLGYRDPDRNFAPVRTPYFVLPKDNPFIGLLRKAYGDKPKSLPILIPREDIDQFASQYYRAYSQSRGLICRGDGETAFRMHEPGGTALPAPHAQTVEWLEEYECLGRECPDYQAKRCREVMCLQFMLPEIPGLGVWQIDTGSKNSILNINSMIQVIKAIYGRVTRVPLNLTLEPCEVKNPETGKKQTVFVLNLRTDMRLKELAAVAREETRLLTVGRIEDEAPDEAPDFEEQRAQAERDSKELFGPPTRGPETTDAAPSEQAKATEPPATPGEPPPPPPSDFEVWYEEQLGILRKRGLKMWSVENTIKRIESLSGQKGAQTEEEALKHLDPAQTDKLCNIINESIMCG